MFSRFFTLFCQVQTICICFLLYFFHFKVSWNGEIFQSTSSLFCLINIMSGFLFVSQNPREHNWSFRYCLSWDSFSLEIVFCDPYTRLLVSNIACHSQDISIMCLLYQQFTPCKLLVLTWAGVFFFTGDWLIELLLGFSGTLLWIQANLSNAVVWMVSILPLILNSFSPRTLWRPF